MDLCQAFRVSFFCYLYFTSHKYKPCGGTVSPSNWRSLFSKSFGISVGILRSCPISIKQPTLIRTMLYKKPLLLKINSISLPRFSHVACDNVRTLLPLMVALAEEKVVKSCSPCKYRQASCIASTFKA